MASMAVVAASAVAGCTAEAPPGQVTATPSERSTNGSNPVVIENMNPGTADWSAPRNGGITGYTDAASVNVGESIRFAVSTTSPRFDLAIYRLGWYGGEGGRLIRSVEQIPGADQGHWLAGTFGLAGCPTCRVEPRTGLVDANWEWSYSLVIPRSWTTGVYIALLATNDGGRGSVPFVVRNDALSTNLLAVLPVNTWQAYNYWGGKSLYASSAYGNPTIAGDKRAVKVSFNRPYALSVPTTQDVNVISFLERSGYDVSYSTDVDLDRDPQLLSRHRVYIAVAHDEYWSKNMRDTVERARDQGVSLAFLGGNDVYWQARYEPDSSRQPRRTLVVYRSASLDPLASTEPAAVTVLWADPPVNRPQNSLTGTLFSNGYPPSPQPWTVNIADPPWLLGRTQLKSGTSISGLVSGECDRTEANPESPASLVILGSAVFKPSGGGQRERCDSTWYTSNHHSAVFSAGDSGWPNLLAGSASDERVITLTRNVLDRLVMLAQPAGDT